MTIPTMRELVVNFPNQLKRSLEIASKSKLTKSKKDFKNILISGLGGSGIGATIVANWISDESKLPININKGYFLPRFVNKKSLVICCSYSGNTEETLKVLLDAHKSGAKVVCISSGGKMIDYCKQNKLDYILIDGGMPPRACLGYSVVQLVHTLSFYKIISKKWMGYFEETIKLLNKSQKELDSKSKELAKKIATKLPILYSDEKMEGVAVRFRQQINENSKMLCWHHVIPEMNHNEIVGWRDENQNLAVLFLNSSFDFGRNVERKKLNEKVIKKYTKNIYNVEAKGKSIVEQSFYLIHFCDFMSCHLADIRKFDASEIDVINALKSSLDKNPILGFKSTKSESSKTNSTTPVAKKTAVRKTAKVTTAKRTAAQKPKTT